MHSAIALGPQGLLEPRISVRNVGFFNLSALCYNSGMQKIWKIKSRTEKDLITQLLLNRGISNTDADSFLYPDYSKLYSPFLFKDMRKAANRLWQALENKEKILIYSDYDADAITANAVIFRALKFLGAEPQVYIPDRFSEGYGLNLEAFRKIKESGVDVVVTVDCGTNSVDEAIFCKENGIDLIITDHHEITGETPDTYALVNPKNPAEEYPYHELTGVAVAFKLVCALFSYKEKHNLPDGFEKWFLDLVAIGTVADCHSLIGENRTIVKYGLQVLQKTKWPGLRALMQLSGVLDKKQEMDTYVIGFIIAPRINAAGRIDHAGIAFDLLVSDDPAKALEIAQQLEKLNSKRQMLTEVVMSEARAQISALEDKKILIAYGNDWPKGVVGLVAGKLTEEFGRPVLVMEKGTEHATGSARSIPSFNIVNALTYSKEYLLKYGGHAAAAGFTLKSEYIDFLYKKLLEFAEENLNEEDMARVIDVEAELRPEEINMRNYNDIERMAPFGVDNFRPKFALMDLIVEDMRAVGKEQKHLQMSLRSLSETSGGKEYIFKCIGFNFGKAINQLRIGEHIDLVFEIISDEWNGFKNLKLRILDFRKTNANE